MSPLAPWFGWWAASIAAGRSALDMAADMISEPTVGDCRSPDHEHDWATPGRVLCELTTMRLREFGAGGASPVAIVVAPFALHAATTADFAIGHSVVRTLLASGVARVLVTDWRSASTEQAGLGIDACLADLNVVVDDAGAPAALAGLCQGGWLAAAYAARFPGKVSRLAAVGAPFDLDAAPGTLGDWVRRTPPQAIEQMVGACEGMLPGKVTQSVWPTGDPSPDEIARCLQIAVVPARLTERFRRWNDDVVDLPGRFFIETVELIFRQNRLARGAFPALGREVGLAGISCPVLLLAARGDELVPPAQLLSAASIVSTPQEDVIQRLVDGPHLSLFMGKKTLRREWPTIARFLVP